MAGELPDAHLVVEVDGKSVLDVMTGAREHVLQQQLAEGEHEIMARIEIPDAISDNNAAYATVRAVPKPSILFWSERQNSPMQFLSEQVFSVEGSKTLPSDLGKYYAVVMNDIPSVTLGQSSQLANYVKDGNGLVVVGGMRSYDRGDYNLLKNILPVTIGSPGKDLGDVNVMIVLDASQSASDIEGAGLSVGRKLTLGLINDLDERVRIGVVAFRYAAEIVSSLAKKGQTTDLEDKVRHISGSGGSNMADGMKVAIEALAQTQGSKNLVIISDGLLLDDIADESKVLAEAAFMQGIKVYAIGAAVGDDDFIAERTDEDFLRELASTAHGIFFRAGASSRLKLLFNPPKDAPERNETDREVQVMDSNHYITQDFLFQNAAVSGYNSVLPKPASRLLATLGTGEPLLVVGRIGLGRVASLATDDGLLWSGALLAKPNSAFLVRTLSWAIGDPERKASTRVQVSDTYLGEQLEVTVTADVAPVSRETPLARTGERTYSGSIPTTKTGFVDIFGTKAAVNAPREYKATGENKALGRVVTATNGGFFKPEDIDGIVELSNKRSLTTLNQPLPLRWPLALACAIIWLIELAVRRALRV